jgi:hypothetical protein
VQKTRREYEDDEIQEIIDKVYCDDNEEIEV